MIDLNDDEKDETNIYIDNRQVHFHNYSDYDDDDDFDDDDDEEY
jgi:hypothetical protein